MVGSPWRWNLIHSKWRFQYWDQVMENRLNFYWPVFISTFRFNISHHQKLLKCVYMINCQITEQHNQNLIHTPTYILINTLQRHIRTCKYLLKLFSAQKMKYLKLLLVLTGQSVWQHMLIEPSRKFDQVWHFYGVSFITPSHQSINQQARKPRSYASMKLRKICRFCNWHCVEHD